MKFEFSGMPYLIEFERTTKLVRVGDKVAPVAMSNATTATAKGFGNSQYPYTTVRLIGVPKDHAGVVKGSKVIYRTATVGCWHRENKKKFSLENGRLNALRAVGKTISKEMRRAMWQAYMNRNAEQKTVTIPVVTLEDKADTGTDIPGGGAI